MNFLRGFIVWLMAPLLASLICTAVWALAGGSAMIAKSGPAAANWQIMIGIGVMTLMFTIPGSTALTGIFALMNSRSPFYRRVFIIVFGILGGGAAMLFIGFPVAFIAIGCAYGFATACFWIGIHWVVYRPRLAQ